MAKAGNRERITLVCTECNEENYRTIKNKKNNFNCFISSYVCYYTRNLCIGCIRSQRGNIHYIHHIFWRRFIYYYNHFRRIINHTRCFIKNRTKNSKTDASTPLKRVRILVKKLSATAHQQIPIKITHTTGRPTPWGTIAASAAVCAKCKYP